ncbi:MAG: transposase [Candidatus Shapirobacteria bacterium]
MPSRKTFFVSRETYHIYNRSIEQQPIFSNKLNSKRILELIDYYRFKDNPLRFSHYNRLPAQNKNNYLDSLYASPEKIKIFSFSIMPSHYHFLIRQELDHGIIDFIRLLQNSYAKYFNIKNRRNGPLFQGPFKGIRVESEEQFTHLSRYIHLNPLSSYVLKQEKELKDYKLNSYMDYISGSPRPFIETEAIMGFFKSKKDYQKFVFNRLDYQRKLERIKHLVLED